MRCRRQLSIPERKSYIDAVQCLTKREAESGVPGAVNRFDDHQGVHMQQKPQIHWVVGPALLYSGAMHANSREQGHFLLWHRYFLATCEMALRDECDYKGGQPSALDESAAQRLRD